MGKLRVYLDTSVVLGWFKKNIKNIKENRQLEPTFKIKFFIDHPEIEIYISDLTIAEIYRYLKSEWNATEELCERVLTHFKLLLEVREIELESLNINFQELLEICKQVPLGKRSITDLVHLQITKFEDFLFLTADKKLVEKVKKYYPKIELFSSFASKFPYYYTS